MGELTVSDWIRYGVFSGTQQQGCIFYYEWKASCPYSLEEACSHNMHNRNCGVYTYSDFYCRAEDLKRRKSNKYCCPLSRAYFTETANCASQEESSRRRRANSRNMYKKCYYQKGGYVCCKKMDRRTRGCKSVR
eukprot:TRINITY_DN109715_c0_g1_i1.p2 TRINITY_DN109715_c0_g1~~TRINITY_DN109715_c0_g1_i1.p2  ORF type:complete len:134 (-),score=8.65 TRINITY_DN109715_c0_g1_i1:393-794(-)